MDLGVMAEVLLARNKDDGDMRAEVIHFRYPAFADVAQGVGVVDGVAEKNDISVGIRQRTKSVVVLLSRRVPQC